MPQVLERERTLVRPPVREVEKRPPRPPRRRLYRWVEWMAYGLGALLVIGLIGLGVRQLSTTEEPLPEDNSVLAVGPRQLDPNFELPEYWVGAPMEETLEEALARIAATDVEDDSVLTIGPRHIDPDFVIREYWVGAAMAETLEEELARLEAEAWMRQDYATRHMPEVTQLDYSDDYGTRHLPGS